MSEHEKQRMLSMGMYTSVANHQPFLGLKSKEVTSRPRINSIVHEMSNQPVTVKKLKEYMHPKHRAIEASKQTKR